MTAAQREVRLVPRGMITEPSRILGGDGGLARAQNVVCRRPGLMEPRGGIPSTVNILAASSGFTTTRYARRWRGENWWVAHDTTKTRAYHGGADGHVIEITGKNENVRAAQVADRMAWAFDGAIRMLDNPEQTAAPLGRLAGAPHGPGMLARLSPGSSPTDPLALPPDHAVGYRCLVVRHPDLTAGTGTKRAQLYGPPSDFVLVRNPLANAASVQIFVPIQALKVGDEVQVYRSSLVVTPATNTPDDEMRLALSHIVTSTDLTNGWVLWTDQMPDGQWNGPALYTNASQDTLLLGNERPYLASDIATYNNMTFYAGARTPCQKTLTLNAIGDKKSDLGRSLCSVYIASGTTTSGSATIAAVPTNVFPYLAIGQRLNEPSMRPEQPNARLCPGGVPLYVVSFDAGLQTITMSGPAGATSSAAFVAWDYVGVTGSTIAQFIYAQWVDPAGSAVFSLANYAPFAPFSNQGLVFAFDTNPATPSSSRIYQGGGFDMERAWNFGHTIAENAPGSASMHLSTVSDPRDPTLGITLTFGWDANDDHFGSMSYVDATNPIFYVVSTKPSAFSVPVDPSNPTIVAYAEQLGGAGRLAWSKLALPESTPLPFFTDIGDPTQPIVRILATSDRLWVFKTDGLWCVSGTDPRSLDVQLVDPTLRMIRTDDVDCSGWAARMGDTIFVWAQGGIFAVGAGGVQRVDSDIETFVRTFTPNPLASATVENPYAIASINDGIVLFGFTSHTYAPAGLALVLHTGTGTWSTWTTSILNGFGTNAVFPGQGSGVSDDGSFIMGSQAGWSAYVDAPGANNAATAPAPSAPILQLADTLTIPSVPVAPNVTTVAADVITIAAAPLPSPTLGALLRDFAGAYFLVTEAITSTTFRVDRAGFATGQAQELLWPINSVATFAATAEGDPMVEKRYLEAYWSFQNLRGGLGFSTAFRKRGDAAPSDAIATTYATDLATSEYQAADREYQERLSVPTDAGMQSGVELTIALAQACRYFALSACVLTYEGMSTLLGRKPR